MRSWGSLSLWPPLFLLLILPNYFPRVGAAFRHYSSDWVPLSKHTQLPIWLIDVVQEGNTGVIIPASYLFGFLLTSATMKPLQWRQTLRGYLESLIAERQPDVGSTGCMEMQVLPPPEQTPR